MADNRRFNSQTFQEWANLPLTKVYLRFLEDQRQQMMADWGRGVPMSPDHQIKARLLLELSTLEWADVEKFYAPEDEAPETESAPT